MSKYTENLIKARPSSPLKRVGARTQPCFTPFVTGNPKYHRCQELWPSCRHVISEPVLWFFWAAELFHYLPLPASTDSVKRLG